MAGLTPIVTSPTRFTFHECLGSGSFGEVYRASARRGASEEVVAVKVLHVERQRQRAAVDRLRDEARMLALLEHAAILRFQEFIRIDGRLAMVTEYVEGVDLSAFEDEGSAMPLKPLLQVIAQVASALQCALTTPSPETGNPLGLVHRDIKPQNIRISARGEVKLLDFGIARTTEIQRDATTSLGEVLCTPGYGSPEILCGDAAGQAGDVYALGVTLFQLLSHQRFHEARTIPRQRKVAILGKRYREYLDQRLGLLPELPSELLALLRQMLAHDHESRPSAAEVEAGLRRIAASLDGPGLEAFSVDLPGQPQSEGELNGRTLEAMPISTEPTQVPVADRRAPTPSPGGMRYSVPADATPQPALEAEVPRDTPAPAPQTAPVENKPVAQRGGVDWTVGVTVGGLVVIAAVVVWGLFFR